MDILSLFACFENLAATATRRQLAVIANAVLTLTGPTTMHGIARWTEKGGSYRTVQRFLQPLCRGLNSLSSSLKFNFFIPSTNIFWQAMKLWSANQGSKPLGLTAFFPA